MPPEEEATYLHKSLIFGEMAVTTFGAVMRSSPLFLSVISVCLFWQACLCESAISDVMEGIQNDVLQLLQDYPHLMYQVSQT